jgi:aldose 1-epimerase
MHIGNQPMTNRVGVEHDLFGYTAEGSPVDRYTLRNARGAMARLIAYGASVSELWMPDRQGRFGDVVLGFDRLSDYERQDTCFGSIIGRVAFRTANGEFHLDGRRHQLTTNDGRHHLHGGVRGFSKAIWRVKPIASDFGPAVQLTHHSPNGDQGYPGALDVTVAYALTEENELRIECTATTDQPTLVNLTHHGCFNLAGAGEGDILGHLLQINADRWLPSEKSGLPTGEIASVRNTPFDFTEPKRIGARVRPTGEPAARYDLCFLCDHRDNTAMASVATIQDPVGGRVMGFETTAPALVVCTGNWLDSDLQGKGGAAYQEYSGICLESGCPPDANHYPYFPSVILRPAETYRHVCVHRFSTM